MSIRGCILGNSHTAALKMGWKRIRDQHPDVSLTFFAARRQLLRKTMIEEGMLKATTRNVAKEMEKSGGTSEIELEDYDFFLIVGGGASSRALLDMLEQHSLRETRLGGEMLISEGFLRDSFESRLQRNAAKHLVDVLTTASGKPVFVVPDPHLPNNPEKVKLLAYVTKVKKTNTFPLMANIFAETMGKVYSNATAVLFQYPETLDGPLLTKSIYARDYEHDRDEDVAPESEDDDLEIDFVHTNAEYGEIFWNRFLAENKFG